MLPRKRRLSGSAYMPRFADQELQAFKSDVATSGILLVIIAVSNFSTAGQCYRLPALMGQTCLLLRSYPVLL
jgi:hypothetical protein